MRLFANNPIFGPSPQGEPRRDGRDDFWFRPLGRQSSTGVPVTLDRALTVPVVLDCLSVLSKSIASLPVMIFERRSNGDKVPRPDHPLMDVFEDPDGEATRHEFFAQMLFDLASGGNGIYGVEQGAIGPVSRLKRYDPQKGQIVERLPDGSRRWTLVDDLGKTRRLVEGEVWHLRETPLIDNLIGSSRIYHGREAIGALISLQEYGAAFIENDATPPIVVEHPGGFKDDASRWNFLRAIKAWTGRKRTSPAVLEHGMKINKLGTTPEESQFIETRKELQQEVARIWQMPPHKVGIMENATFTNIEHQGLEFVTDTLTPWIELIENSIRKHLILNPRRFFMEFNVAGLLRGDIEARFKSYAVARQWGWLSVNEIRRLENMNPIGQRGDQYLQPMNMTPAGVTVTRPDAQVLGPGGEVVSRRIGEEWERLYAA